MIAEDVLLVVRTLTQAGVPCWIGGGWGIDALVGEVTRQHRDLDIAIPSELDQAAIDALTPAGYQMDVDQRPARFLLTAPGGRAIDIHPVTFDGIGNGIQQGFDGAVFHYPADGFTTGNIADEAVLCLTAQQQVRFHLGYPPLDHDRRDMAVLADRLGVRVPGPYYKPHRVLDQRRLDHLPKSAIEMWCPPT